MPIVGVSDCSCLGPSSSSCEDSGKGVAEVRPGKVMMLVHVSACRSMKMRWNGGDDCGRRGVAMLTAGG